MKANSIILAALLTLAGFGAGMFVGGQLASSKASTAAAVPASSPGKARDRLPTIRVRSKASGADSAPGAGEPASLAEIEAAIQKAIRLSSNRSYKAINELMRKVNPADIPQLLAFVEKLSSANYKPQLRSMLLGAHLDTAPV